MAQYRTQALALIIAMTTNLAVALPIWTQANKLTAGDAAVIDEFGCSVGVSGATVIVGAHKRNENGTDSGAAYVFTGTGGVWAQQQKLIGTDTDGGDNFGFAVAVSGDTAVVGAWRDVVSGTDSGSAYVFTRSGTTWSQQQKLTSGDVAEGDRFGYSVAISGDTIVVGAYGDDILTTTGAGSAYVFTRSGATWSHQQKLTATIPAASDEFGKSVSIDGDSIAVGSNRDDTISADAGAIYVFTRSGVTWTEQAKLHGADTVTYDRFGESVAISGDTVVAGALYDDDVANKSGSAYVFTRSETVWTQQQKLTAHDPEANDEFGSQVAISGDTVVAGVRRDDDDGGLSGSAYVFTRTGTTWSAPEKHTADDAAGGDEFGQSVAIDGSLIVIGSPLDDDGGSMTGSAYLFTKPSAGGGDPPSQATVVPSLAIVVTVPSVDPELQPVTYKVKWDSSDGPSVTHNQVTLVNGVLCDVLVETHLLAPGQTWTVTITPNDGTQDGLETILTISSSGTPGDMNGDGEVTVADVLDLVNYINGL